MKGDFAGVDVGGTRKGFHIALIRDRHVVHGPVRVATVRAAADLVSRQHPAVVAVDAPREPAADGSRIRDCELRFIERRICGIRPTPSRERLHANRDYYAWVEMGLELYAALAEVGVVAVECFPTAAWTVWGGARGGTSRARWSAGVLASLRLGGVPARLGQDARDAIGAALVARAYALQECEEIGDIVVPAIAVRR